MDDRISYEIEAFNTATASENRIHDDGIAKRFGFQGGLVPGVDVYAYMTRAALIGLGRDFLSRGEMTCRFGQPVYDGETVTVTGDPDGEGGLTIQVAGRGQTLATGTARLLDNGGVPVPDSYAVAELPSPEDRPPAGPASLPEGSALGVIRETADKDGQTAYRADIRETHGLYGDAGLVHPGFLLRRANSALKDNVRLGPWIHVGSTVRHFAALPAGSELETRSSVRKLYDHKGHGFVELDVALFSGGRAIAQIDHVAIYEPRQVRTRA
ncbi:MAG: hypothetical protein ACMVY4_09420 [Minwuia sp.]|uniref:hypothetical protein n=1 Tax=Minwuia sp. TaxID=2493630 RepID=UPI003A8B0669